MLAQESLDQLIDAVKQDEIITVYELLCKYKNILNEDSAVIEFIQNVMSVEILQLLLQDCSLERIKLCIKNFYGMSLINYCIMHGKSIDIITEFVNMGEDINTFDQRYRTPLIESLVNYRDVNFIEKLISMGADVNKFDNYYRSPLHFAHKKDIVALLLKHSANVNNADDNGQTPLLRALELNRDRDTIMELVEGGAKLNCVDQNGNSVLHLTNDPVVFSYFVRHNATPINGKNNKGQTPLMKSVKEHKQSQLIKIILENGGDPNAKDVNLNTPLHYAYNSEIVNLLVSFGGNINAKNEYNQIPFYTIFHHRPITFSFGFNSAEAILKHTLLCNDSEIPKDTSSTGAVMPSNFRMLIEVCKDELAKMKEHKITDNLSFYDFCTFKKTRYNRYINVTSSNFKYNNDKIKELFPNFYDIILIKMKRNELEIRRHNLCKRLNQISLRTKSHDKVTSEVKKVDLNDSKFEENLRNAFINSVEFNSKNQSGTDLTTTDDIKYSSAEMSETIELDYDSLCCVSHYLNYSQLSNLFRAALL